MQGSKLRAQVISLGRQGNASQSVLERAREHNTHYSKDKQNCIKNNYLKMSGKLIMKRKLDKQQTPPAPEPQSIGSEQGSEVVSGSNSRRSSSELNRTERNENNLKNETDFSASLQQSKRLRCDTPPPEPEDEEIRRLHLDGREPTHEDILNNQRNRELLEAIQSKVMELQRELDEFEDDFQNYEDDTDDDHHQQQHVMSDQEAEALGYAMCAQETILFLQRQGIPSDSLLYTRLHEALVGRGPTDRSFQI